MPKVFPAIQFYIPALVKLMLFLATMCMLSSRGHAQNNSANQNISTNAAEPVNLIPLKIIDFFGRVQKDIISIKWITAAEMNVNHIELEKSIDGINYTCINKQTGKGVGNNADAYQAEDFKPSNGINYYRLKIVSNYGKTAYSKIMVVKYKD